MTRSGAPFHGAHGEGRTAISPAASQAGAEPCARAFPAARARRNAPVISDNAVVAAPMNWRAESTGNPLPLSRPATQLAEIMAKVDRPCGFRLRCCPEGAAKKNLQLLADGVHPKIAQERLGHSTITTTMDLYSHVTDTMQADAAARLDAAFRSAINGRVSK